MLTVDLSAQEAKGKNTAPARMVFLLTKTNNIVAFVVS